ncbi:MAG: O-antigen ligase family protein [Ectothiorhodospiraceae bacterium]|nr:O-antigen ligase family protein [Chromatiales bacterium]MCP5155957.1 O-antigen ligase family protein [Ectothiorhodospiraceae bacterium]
MSPVPREVMLPRRGPWGTVAGLAELAMAVALAFGIAALVVHDRMLGPSHPLWQSARRFELTQDLLWTGTSLVVAVAVVLAVRLLPFAFEHRFRLAAVAFALILSVNGINFGRLDIFELTFFPLLALWLATTLAEGRPVLTPRAVLAMAVLLGLGGIASVISGRATSAVTLHVLLSKLVLMFLVSNLINSRSVLHFAARVLVWAGVLSALVAILSQVLIYTVGYELSFVDAATERYKRTAIGRFLRATAFCQAPQTLGHLLVIAIGIAAITIRSLWRAVLVVGVMLVGVVMTFSMGSIMSAGVVLAIAPFLRYPRLGIHFATLYLLAGVVAYMTGLVDLVYEEVIHPLGASGVSIRLEMFRRAIVGIADHPWFGIGLMNPFRELDLPVHNVFLQAAHELGVPSLLVFVALNVYLLVRLTVIGNMLAASPDRALVWGLLLAAIGVLVHFMSIPIYLHVSVWVFLGMLAAAVAVLERAAELGRRVRADGVVP